MLLPSIDIAAPSAVAMSYGVPDDDSLNISPKPVLSIWIWYISDVVETPTQSLDSGRSIDTISPLTVISS